MNRISFDVGAHVPYSPSGNLLTLGLDEPNVASASSSRLSAFTVTLRASLQWARANKHTVNRGAREAEGKRIEKNTWISCCGPKCSGARDSAKVGTQTRPKYARRVATKACRVVYLPLEFCNQESQPASQSEQRNAYKHNGAADKTYAPTTFIEPRR